MWRSLDWNPRWIFLVNCWAPRWKMKWNPSWSKVRLETGERNSISWDAVPHFQRLRNFWWSHLRVPFCLEETVWFDYILLNYCNVYDIYDIYDVKKLKEQHTLKLSGSNIQLIFLCPFFPASPWWSSMGVFSRRWRQRRASNRRSLMVWRLNEGVFGATDFPW